MRADIGVVFHTTCPEINLTITSFEIATTDEEFCRVRSESFYTGFPWAVTVQKRKDHLLLVFTGSLNEGYIPDVRITFSKGSTRFFLGYYENAPLVRSLFFFGLVVNSLAAVLGPPVLAFKLLWIALLALFMWAMFFFSFCSRLQKLNEKRLELSRHHPGLEEFLS